MSITVQEVFDFFNKQYKNEKGELIDKLKHLKTINEYPEVVQDLLEFINKVKNNFKPDEVTITNEDKSLVKGYLGSLLVSFINNFEFIENKFIYKKPGISNIKTFKDLTRLPIEFWYNDEFINMLWGKNRILTSRKKEIIQFKTLLFTLWGEKKENLPIFNNLDDLINYSLSKNKIVFISDFGIKELLTKEENKDIEKIELKEPDGSSSNKWYYEKPNNYILSKHIDKKDVWLIIPDSFFDDKD